MADVQLPNPNLSAKDYMSHAVHFARMLFLLFNDNVAIRAELNKVRVTDDMTYYDLVKQISDEHFDEHSRAGPKSHPPFHPRKRR